MEAKIKSRWLSIVGTAGAALGLVLSSVECGRRGRQVTIPAQPPPSLPPALPPPAAGPSLTLGEGIASWYGNPFHGRRTASGEIYNMYGITAAHRTLAFGTRVRVHNLENDLNLVVRINDRGPFIAGRIIDLSYGAARVLRMEGRGTARVRLEVLDLDRGGAGTVQAGIFAVQVGAFRELGNAERLRAKIASRFQDVMIQSLDRGDGLFHRVQVGRKNTEEEARDLARSLRAADFAAETLVVRLN